MESHIESYTRTSKLALIALLLSIPCVVTGPFALIPIAVGVVALWRISMSVELKGRVVAVSAIVVGVIGVAGTKIYYDSYERAQFYQAQTWMRSHSQAVMVYMGNNYDRPFTQEDWPRLAVEQGLIDPRTLVSPREDGDGVTYTYIASFDVWNETSIMMYEDPDHWDQGVIVAFGDAHVEVLPRDEFERRLAEQLRTTNP